MIDKNTNPRESEQSYQHPISRRNLLRAGGATAGVAAAGGIPTATGISQPVGQARAVPLIPVGIGLIGIGAAAGLAYDEIFGQSAEDVKDSVDKQTIFNTFDTAVQNNRIVIGQESEKVGVDNSTPPTSPGDNVITPGDNPHVNEMVSQAFSAATQKYQQGEGLAEMKNAARKSIKVSSVISEWTVISTWNTLIKSLGKALLLHEQSFPSSTEVISNSYNSEYIASYDSPDHQMASKTSDTDGIIGVRDIGSTMPVDISTLPSDEQPENGFKIVEVCINDSGGDPIDVISPQPYNSPHESGISFDALNANLTATYQSSTATVETWRYREILRAIYQIRNTQLSNIDTSIENLKTELDSDNVKPNDFVSAEDLYNEFDSPGDVTRQAVELMAAGVYDYVSSDVTVSFDGSTHTGLMFVDVTSDIQISPGDTIAASEHNGGQILLSDSDADSNQVSIPDDVDITIDSISGDKSQITYTDRKRYTNDGTDVSDLRDQIQSQNNRYKNLQEKIEELDNDGPLGGGGGIGGLLGENGLIVAGGALVAAYLLGR